MYQLARRLPNADIVVLAPASPGDAAFDNLAGLQVRRLASARVGQRLWLAELVAATIARCCIDRPDLIVCGHVVTAPAALAARKLLGVPYAVFTYAFEIRRRRHRRLVTRVLKSAAVVLTDSHFTRESVYSHGVPLHRVRILYPGADVDGSAGEPVPEESRRDRSPILLSVSRLVDLYKGHDTVIRALPLIHAKCAETRYVIVGGGPLREYLERLARSLGVDRYVVFTGEVDDARLAELYRSCDLFIQLSREARTGGGAEGFGIACLEASAAGKAVIAGRSGGLPDAVSDGVSGVLVDPTDLGGVAEAIISLLRDRSMRERLGRDGRARVLREFTWDHMAQQARTVFAEAAGSA
jgi:phosphatidylinositol alpha-1,6-mannosyltransferase